MLLLRTQSRFLGYAEQHGGENLSLLTAEAATPLFDQILEAAATEFITLAPSSSRFVSASLTKVVRQVEALSEIQENTRHAAEGVYQLLSVVMAQSATHDEPAGSPSYRTVITQLGGMTEAELIIQQRVVKVVQEFADLTYETGAIPPGRARAEPKPSAIVLEAVGREASAQDYIDQPWVAVEYLPKLEVQTVNQAIAAKSPANGILAVGLDGSAIAAWVAVGRADPITLPSPLEIDQDWPTERVVREALRWSFPGSLP